MSRWGWIMHCVFGLLGTWVMLRLTTRALRRSLADENFSKISPIGLPETDRRYRDNPLPLGPRSNLAPPPPVDRGRARAYPGSPMALPPKAGGGLDLRRVDGPAGLADGPVDRPVDGVVDGPADGSAGGPARPDAGAALAGGAALPPLPTPRTDAPSGPPALPPRRSLPPTVPSGAIPPMQGALVRRPHVATSRALSSVRRVHGRPIVWKDTERFWQANRSGAGISAAMLLVVMVIWLVVALLNQHPRGLLGLWGSIFVIALAATAMLASRGVSFERQSKTWLVLLTTPASDWQIVADKLRFVGQTVRPFWLALLGAAVLSVVGGLMPAAFVLESLALGVGASMAVAGSSFLIGLRTRHTIHAMLASLGLWAGLWGLPLLMRDWLLRGAAGPVMHRLLLANPLHMLDLLTPRKDMPRELVFPGGAAVTGWALTALVVAVSASLALVGWGLMVLSARQLRRDNA